MLRSKKNQVENLKIVVDKIGIRMVLIHLLISYYANKHNLFGFYLLDTPTKLLNNYETQQESIERIFEQPRWNNKLILKDILDKVERDEEVAMNELNLK